MKLLFSEVFQQALLPVHLLLFEKPQTAFKSLIRIERESLKESFCLVFKPFNAFIYCSFMQGDQKKGSGLLFVCFFIAGQQYFQTSLIIISLSGYFSKQLALLLITNVCYHLHLV